MNRLTHAHRGILAPKKKEGADNKVRYPIGIKLVTIITILLLISLGAITVLVSVLVSGDLQITAEDNNFTVNRRSAAEAENILQTFRSNALVLLNSLSTVGDSSADARQLGAFYFEQNITVAALVTSGAGAGSLINERFFEANEIEASLVDEFMARSAPSGMFNENGAISLLNAAPVFGIPALAMRFPWEGSRGQETVTLIISTESLADTFGSSVNVSFLINHDGDVLVHPDHALIIAGVNMLGDPLVDIYRESPEQNLQTLYTDREGIRYFGAFRKLSFANAAVLTIVEYETVFEGIAVTTQRNILLTGAVLFLSILFIWFFSKTISQPLGRLTSAARKIEAGLFEVNLTETSRDEISLLSESFVKMSSALVTFSRFTNLEIAKRAMRGDLTLGGETRQATIFFSDIRSFTSISERLEPEEVVEFLNDYMTRMVDCVNQTGGTVDKFIGDAVMAHWGAASTAGTPAADALNCVRAALAMRIALREFNQGRDDSVKHPRIWIGCGINTGSVVAGQIGSHERMEYTVIGDAVNLASRTEALNKPLHTDILITENTWELIREHIIAEEMPSVTVKGKKKLVRMFAVINLRARAGEQQKRPVSLGQVRTMLGYAAPDLANIDTGAEEQKYKIAK
ncbi:adenylate/guanylate cyclase domain-containing protein [Spirochaetia bacterium]|nr:adenylate/guanylate cyclase domain-containing protein [Spirochaetia bacterium]